MAEDNSWQCPDTYGSLDAEVQAIRERVGLRDISSMSKLEFQGQASLSALAQWLAIDADAISKSGTVTQIPAAAVSLESHTSALLCCLTKDRARLITSPGTAESVQSRYKSATDIESLHITDITSSLTAVQIAGPNSRDLLIKLTALDLRAAQFPNRVCAQGSLAKVHVLIVRADIQAHLSYHVYYGREFGQYVWNALMDAGEDFGVAPFGLAAQRQVDAEG